MIAFPGIVSARAGGNPVRYGLMRELIADNAAAGAVASWPDTSGNNDPAVQSISGLRPTKQSAAANGHAGILFDGVDDYLALTPDATITAASWVIALSPNTTASIEVFSTGVTDSYWRFSVSGNGFFGTFRSVRLESYPTGTPSSGNHILSGVSSITNFQAWIDGADQGAQTPAFGAGETWYVGAASVFPPGNPTRSWSGYIYEVALYNRVLTSGERHAVEGYMSAKYGIPVIQA